MKAYDLKPTRDNLLKTYQTDSIGRNNDLFHFICILNAIEDGCSIALDGKWGSGKTFFVKQAKMVMDAHNNFIKTEYDDDRCMIKAVAANQSIIEPAEIQPQVCVYFDAWESDNDDDPILSMVYAILNSVDEDFSFSERSFLDTTAGLMQLFTGKDWKQLIDGLKGENPFKKIKQSKHIEELVNEFLESLLPEHGNRLVVFIDELDRCNPNFAVRLLERLKHYFTNDRITFVFSVNTNELQHTIRKYYGNDFDASRYLDRFFDLRMSLSLPDMEKFYQSIGFSSGWNRYDTVCDAVIKEYHLELREISRYLRATKLAAYEPTHSELYRFSFAEELGLQFSLIYVVPIMICLQICNIKTYQDFVEGKDSFPLIRIAGVLNPASFSQLLTQNETYGEKSENGTKVQLNSKLQEAYEAIFATAYHGGMYSKSVGKLTFNSKTKEELLRVVGLTSQFTRIAD